MVTPSTCALYGLKDDSLLCLSVQSHMRTRCCATYRQQTMQCSGVTLQSFVECFVTVADTSAMSLLLTVQAKLLWPELDMECVVSLGCGVPAPGRRERSMSAYLEMGSILIESACSTDRVHEALATLLPAARTQYYRCVHLHCNDVIAMYSRT
jgi:hypothetical protein